MKNERAIAGGAGLLVAVATLYFLASTTEMFWLVELGIAVILGAIVAGILWRLLGGAN